MARLRLALANGIRQRHRHPPSLVAGPVRSGEHVALGKPGRSEAVRLSLRPPGLLSQTFGLVREAQGSGLCAVVGAPGTPPGSRRSTRSAGALSRARRVAARILVWETVPCP